MKYTLTAMAAVVIALFFPSFHAHADDTSDIVSKLLTQSENMDPNTQAEIKKFLGENQGLIKTIVELYSSHLKDIQSMMDNTGTGSSARQGASASASSGSASDELSEALNSSGAQSGQAKPASKPAPKEGLETGQLGSAHLAGYPSLPDVPPTSSILNPTTEQLSYKAYLDHLTRQRQAFLMEHPNPYYYP